MYAHICSAQTAASRVRVRGTATHSATGAAAAEAVTNGGGIRRRRRASGTATPTTTTPQAAARRALDGRMEVAMLTSRTDSLGAVTDFGPGDVFAGHRIEAVAGRGGMGVVYRAIQIDLDRPVALKVIAPHLAQDEAFRERFVAESRVAAAIDHPHVLPIYYAGESDGTLYIAMRFVDGSDLRHVIRAEGAIEPGRAARIVDQVGGALGAGDHAYLTDFGLTKRVGASTGLSRSGQWVGTLGYVAPEQIRGERIDARADVYALGCVLFHALTGQAPYLRETEEATLWSHLHDPPPPASMLTPGVPEAFDDVVERALAKDPDDRYPSAGDLGRAALAAAGAPVAAED